MGKASAKGEDEGSRELLRGGRMRRWQEKEIQVTKAGKLLLRRGAVRVQTAGVRFGPCMQKDLVLFWEQGGVIVTKDSFYLSISREPAKTSRGGGRRGRAWCAQN